jgi:hypothetical protein
VTPGTGCRGSTPHAALVPAATAGPCHRPALLQGDRSRTKGFATATLHSENGQNSDLGPICQMRARMSRFRPDQVGFVSADCLRSGLPDSVPRWGRLSWSKGTRPAFEDFGMPSTAHASPIHCRSDNDTIGRQSLYYPRSQAQQGRVVDIARAMSSIALLVLYCVGRTQVFSQGI